MCGDCHIAIYFEPQTKRNKRTSGGGNMLNDGASSDDEGSAAGGPALPAGVLRSSTAWGDDLEMKHKRERIRQGQDAGDGADQHAAVDINQFRNVEVGRGYQARHVVRQKTGNEDVGGGMKVRDMTGGASVKERTTSDRTDNKPTKETDKSSKRSKKHKEKTDATDKRNMADQYLKCKGVREFRLELEKILSSA